MDSKSNESNAEPVVAVMDTDDEESDEIDDEIDEIDNVQPCHDIFSAYNSETEEELTDDETVDGAPDHEEENVFLGKDKSVWRKIPTDSASIPKVDIGALCDPNVKAANTVLDSWNLFFTFVDVIVENTNIYIRKQHEHHEHSPITCTTNTLEIRALIGLLYFAGLCNHSKAAIQENWECRFGLKVFNETMDLQRFEFLMQCLRFDNIDTRSERRKSDRLAAIREILDKFNKNCAENYNVGQFVTVDDKFKRYRGGCSFKKEIPNYPNYSQEELSVKYGLKFFFVVDAKTCYTSRLEIDCGQQPPGPYNVSNDPAEIVKRITHHLQGAGRNITIDKWLNTYSLAMDLLEKKTTLVGTLTKESQELPRQFYASKNRAVRSTMFGFKKEATICSYVPKGDSCILFVSTMHHAGAIKEGRKQIPEIKALYDSTRRAVGRIGGLCNTYYVGRRRWPLLVFFTLLDLAAVNSCIVFLLNDDPAAKHKGRKKYIWELAAALTEPYNDYKATEHQMGPVAKRMKPTSPGRCEICPLDVNNQTTASCSKCNRHICENHTEHVCITCFQCSEVAEQEESIFSSSECETD